MRRIFALALVAAAVLAPAPVSSQTAQAVAPPLPVPSVERPLTFIPIPADRTSVPKPSEWASAVRVRLTRQGPAAAPCSAWALREWLRVRCATDVFALSLLGGELDGVAFWIDAKTKEGEVILPLRRGGRHVVQLWKSGKDAQGAFAPEPLVLLQQHWVEGEPAPVVTLL
ncbi:MAG: hypothetical protein QM820_65740 [Minicystis sp.]